MKANCTHQKTTNQQIKWAKLFRDSNDKYFAFADKLTSKQSFLKKQKPKIKNLKPH